MFGAPFCGGAPYALSVIARETETKTTLFFAKRKNHHRRQVQAYKNGAKIYEVPYGYMSNVQSKARKYAQENGALFLPLGFDVPEAEEPFTEFMSKINSKYKYDQIWCAVGSGMLARCLSRGFPDTEIHGVAVGLKSRNTKQNYGSNLTLHDSGMKFEKAIKYDGLFPSCEHYDMKAWKKCKEMSKGKVLFWNVMS